MVRGVSVESPPWPALEARTLLTPVTFASELRVDSPVQVGEPDVPDEPHHMPIATPVPVTLIVVEGSPLATTFELVAVGVDELY